MSKKIICLGDVAMHEGRKVNEKRYLPIHSLCNRRYRPVSLY